MQTSKETNQPTKQRIANLQADKFRVTLDMNLLKTFMKSVLHSQKQCPILSNIVSDNTQAFSESTNLPHMEAES